jgi:hypothetical protein
MRNMFSSHEPSGRQHPEHLRIRPGDAHAVNILVTSAAGTNGDGYGSILAFTLDGKMLGAFGADLFDVSSAAQRTQGIADLLDAVLSVEN